MVHALHEAQRVLQPNGILFDLRPAPVHRRVGLRSDASYAEIGVMKESFEDDYFANRAVKQMLREGLFKSERYIEFNCNRVMDTFKEFHAWMADFIDLGRMPSQNKLLKLVEQAYYETPGRKKIIVSAPLMLTKLRILTG